MTNRPVQTLRRLADRPGSGHTLARTRVPTRETAARVIAAAAIQVRARLIFPLVLGPITAQSEHKRMMKIKQMGEYGMAHPE